MKKLWLPLFICGALWAQDLSYPEADTEILTQIEAAPYGTTQIINQASGGLISSNMLSNQAAKSINATQLNSAELGTISRSIPEMAASITKAGIFPLLDAEARYYRNPDAAPSRLSNSSSFYAQNPYLQFLYGKDIANNKEYLSHKTNGTTFYNSYGVYNMRLGLIKENSPLTKKNYEKWGELELVVFSKLRYAPPNTYGETIRLILYGTDNKKQWNKEFSFNLNQAQNQTFEGGLYSLTLSHLLEKQEIEDLRLLFKANRIIFGKVEGSINSFTFDFRPNASYFYRIFLEYGKNNRYF